MRPKINPQLALNLQPPTLKLTRQYYAKYQAFSALLDAISEPSTMPTRMHLPTSRSSDPSTTQSLSIARSLARSML